MIASIEGKVAGTYRDHVIIVTGGIGYKVFAPHSTLERLTADHAFLHTVMIVREDAITLYGFATTAERELFEILISISGVGPKMALATLSTLSIDNLRNAVISERSEILARVPGIGKKTAQKILIELKDKLKIGLDAVPVDGFDDINTDVMDALVALGYSIVEAQTAIQSLPKDAPQDIEERVRLALQYFI
ncbi:MAG: Holliday junction branch migration protein RuvA [Anaerolineae bacterium]|nr:Holliday junction branch migration protein RuvA [Anaerolineae bacterium]